MDVPKIFGRYQPLQVLGAGSGSRVMLVKDLLDGETRALKVLLDESGTEGFFREFELLASIQHPQVIKVFDFGQDASGLRYFTMEHLPGRPLAAAVPDQLSIPRIQRIAGQILSALAAIHARGILHADLKPQNIFLVEEGDGNDRIKLLDFGLAGLRKDRDPGKRRGTLPYMAPEWFHGEDIDHRSDLYSTGIVLYELLAGETPFDGMGMRETIEVKVREPVPSISLIRNDLPEPLVKLLDALLERDPALRPQTAAEALKVLEQGGNDPSTSSAVLLSGLPLVGRERLMGALRGVLDAVSRTSSGRMILLTGHAGSGKTRILQELRGTVQREGHKLIEARGGDVQGEPPLRQLFFSPVKLEAETHKQLLSRYQPVVQQLFAERPEAQARIPALTPAEKLGFLDGLAGLLLELAARTPHVVLLDDLHLADPMTQDMFVHLGWRLAEAPLLVCATVDPGWLEGRTDFQELIERPEVEKFQLEPLTVEDLQHLVRETFGAVSGMEDLAAQLETASAGSPAMVSEVLESLVDAGALYNERGRWHVSEQGVSEFLSNTGEQDRAAALFKRRLEPLTATEHELLNAAAVLGTELEVTALSGLAGGGAWVGEALRSLQQHGILTSVGVGGEVIRFVQPRLPGWLLTRVPPEHRRALHRRAGEFVLASLGSAVADPEKLPDAKLDALARHFLAAGNLDAGRTFGILAAARAEQHQALRQALERYQQLLALATSHHLPAPFDVREKIADLEARLGRSEVALQEYEALLSNGGPALETGWLPASTDPLPARARLFFKQGAINFVLGNPRAALEASDQVLPLIPPNDVLTQIQCAGDRSNYLLAAADLEGAEKAALEGLGLVEGHPSPWQLAPVLRLHCLLGNIHSSRHQLTTAEEYVLRGIELAKELPDNLPYQEARELRRHIGTLHFIRGRILVWKEMYPEAVQALVEALGHYEALRDLTFMGKCYNNMGVCYFHMGEWGEAIDYWERQRDIAERTRARTDLIYASSNLGWMYKETGQLDRAATTFEYALQLSRRLQYTLLLHTLLGNLGETRARQGNFSDARRLYEQAIQIAREQQNMAELVENLRRMAELSLEEGRPSRVRREVHEALELARQAGIKVEEANLLSLQGAEAAERNLTDRALAAFRQGDDILRDLKADIERARLKYRQGIAFNKLGFPSEAESAMRFAEETFRRMGAGWDLRRTREALQKLGGDGGGGLAFKKLQLLLDVTRTLGAELELEPLLNTVLEKAIELTHTERGFVILFDDKGNPTFHSTRSMGRADVEAGETAQISSTVIQRVVASRTAMAVTNIDQEFDLRAQASIVALGLRSIMCAPLKRGERILGVIYVDSSKVSEGFYQADVSLLEALADTAAISLENAQLVGALRRKTDLMSILAHEFRSPITASITFTHQLLREADRLTAEQRDSLEAILEQGYRLSRMINNILELARMEANKVEWWMEEIELDQILTSSARGLEPLSREKQVQVTVRAPEKGLTVYGNSDRLIQVCTNLLGNSLKFTPERGRVEISADVIEIPRGLRTRSGKVPAAGETWVTRTLGSGRRLSDTQFLAVRFTDSGPGIPTEDLERIFGKFAQSGDIRSRAQGTGLGLTIAQEIVTQHGGRMWAENAPTGGAMFVFCLPLVVSMQ